MNILELLQEDHRKVESMLEELSDTTTRAVKTRVNILKQMKKELQLHEEIEETIFYPPLREYKETHDLVLEAFEEHHLVDEIIAELDKVEPKDEVWKAKLTVLKENLEHHIKEEEGELFKQAIKILGKEVLQEMGLKMQAVKDKAV